MKRHWCIFLPLLHSGCSIRAITVRTSIFSWHTAQLASVTCHARYMAAKCIGKILPKSLATVVINTKTGLTEATLLLDSNLNSLAIIASFYSQVNEPFSNITMVEFPSMTCDGTLLYHHSYHRGFISPF